MRRTVTIATVLALVAAPVVAGGGHVASAAGAFSSVSPLITGRSQAAVAKLASGKVLLAGGSSNGTDLASAEVYDPATASFAPTASLPATRVGALAVTLKDGRVLVAGGLDNQSKPTGSAYIFDPGAPVPAFVSTGTMTVARWGFTLTLLADGKVLAAGGYSTAFLPTVTADVYDPATGLFTPTARNMSWSRGQGVAVRLASGKVLIAGGEGEYIGGSRAELATAEVYDPATRTFALTGSMRHSRIRAGAALLPNGNVLVVGGGDADSPWGQQSAEVYDVRSRRFVDTGGMDAVRDGPLVTPLADGRVLVTGGVYQGVGVTPYASELTAEAYNPATGLFTPAGSTTRRISYANAPVLLNSGKVLIAGGGYDTGAGETRQAQLFNGPLPGIAITGRPAARTASRTATVRFRSASYSPRFQCKLDARAWATCASGVTYKRLARGAHALRVRALSLGVTGAPVTVAWRIT